MIEDASLITAAMQAVIGRESEPSTLHIIRALVERLIDAVEDDDPQLRSALNSADSQAEVPPYVINADRIGGALLAVPDLPNFGLLAADELEVLGPVRLGDTLTAVRKVADIQERIGGRVGQSIFVQHETRFTNQDGNVVARTRITIAHFIDEEAQARRREEPPA